MLSVILRLSSDFALKYLEKILSFWKNSQNCSG